MQSSKGADWACPFRFAATPLDRLRLWLLRALALNRRDVGQRL